MDAILSLLSLMAAALVRGIAIPLCKYTFFQKTLAHGVVLHAPFGKQVSVSGKDYLCVAELCVSETR